MSELTPPFWRRRGKYTLPKGRGQIQPTNLRSLAFRKFGSHLRKGEGAMLKKILTVLIAGIVILGLSKISFAMSCGDHSKQGSDTLKQKDKEQGTVTATSAKEKVEAGNKICPVMGTKIEKGKQVKYEYKGKVYNFCCPMCIDEFKKDPEKYIQKVEEEKQKENLEKAASEKSESETTEHHREHK